MGTFKRLGRYGVALVALDLLHEDTGEVDKVSADAEVLGRSVIIGADALIGTGAPAWSKFLLVGVGRSSGGGAVAMNAGVVVVESGALRPGIATGTTMTGCIRAFLGAGLV